MKFRKLVSILCVLGLTLSSVSCGKSTPAADANTAVDISSGADAGSAVNDGSNAAAQSPAETAAASPAAGESKTEAASAKSTAELAALAEEIKPEDVFVTWEDSHVYIDLTLGKYKTIPTYGVKGCEDVPFVSVQDYLDILCEGKETITMEDGILKILVNGTHAEVNPAEDTIWFENPARFRSAGEIDGSIVGEEEYNVVTPSRKNRSVQEEASPFTVSLKDYYMPLIAYEDTVIAPFLALQNTFGSICMSNVLAYNGRDYFNAFEAESYTLEDGREGVKESPYYKRIFSGPFSDLDHTSQAYADYGYYSVCLLLDLTYGHKEEKNITTFDEYFTRMNAKTAMRSTDPSSAMMAELLLFSYLFDSGHDAFFSWENVFGDPVNSDLSEAGAIADDIKNSEEGEKLFSDAQQAVSDDPNTNAILGMLAEKGLKIPEVAPLYIWSSYFETIKPANYGNQRLDFSGDTAVIYFNSFKDNITTRKPSFYLDPINDDDIDKSTFAFFYKSFEEIRQHEEVKNVVINLADNGGGAATALVCTLGFLSPDGEVRISLKDMIAGSYREEWYHVDTNLDGIADDQDGFGGQYDFYILCSGNSYSCGNALPYFAQKEGLAKIMGSRPGGGDCVVGSFIDAYGRSAFYSGMLKLGTDDGRGFVSDEKATTVDLEMMHSVWDLLTVPWYNARGIAAAVDRYEKGNYNVASGQKSDFDKISDFLTGLLEGLEIK